MIHVGGVCFALLVLVLGAYALAAHVRRMTRFEDARACGRVALQHIETTIPDYVPILDFCAIRRKRKEEAELAFRCADAVARLPGGPKFHPPEALAPHSQREDDRRLAMFERGGAV